MPDPAARRMEGLASLHEPQPLKFLRTMPLIAFAGLEPGEGAGGSDGKSFAECEPRRWVWHGLFITNAPDRSVRHSLGSGVGGLGAPMGAKDLGLSCCEIKGDLAKSEPPGSAAAGQGTSDCRAGESCDHRRWGKSVGRGFSSLGGGFSGAWPGFYGVGRRRCQAKRGWARLTDPFLHPRQAPVSLLR